jgi:hypothetical protein
MKVLATFSSAVFNALPGPYVPSSRDAHVAALLSLIVKHGLSREFGVSLNHAHFTVTDETPVTISTLDADGIELRPASGLDGALLPYMFLFRGDEVMPLQYIDAKQAPPLVTQLVHQMQDSESSVSALLRAYNTYLQQHNVQVDFGIIIKVISSFPLTAARSLAESTYHQASGYTQVFRMDSTLNMEADFKTQWYTNPDAPGDHPLHCFCSSGNGMRCHK